MGWYAGFTLFYELWVVTWASMGGRCQVVDEQLVSMMLYIALLPVGSRAGFSWF